MSAWAAYEDQAGAMHVLPMDDLKPHVLGDGCWCKPTPEDDRSDIVVHHSMDRREYTREMGRVQ